MKACDIMTEPALMCSREIPVAAAARLMRDFGYGALPVIDQREHLVGIITDRDVCRAIARSKRNAWLEAVQPLPVPLITPVRQPRREPIR